MAGLDFDNVVVSVDGRTVNTIAGAAPVFAVEATWGGIEDKPLVFPPAPHDHDGVYLPIHGTADLSGGLNLIQLTNEDLNDLIPANLTWYYAAGTNTVTNIPLNTGNSSFSMAAFRIASGNRIQILFNSLGRIYQRIYRSNTWSPWVQWPVNFASAGYHNSIYRGYNIGSEVTAEQYASISAGTFENMFVGDYWAINDVNWRIAAFDYWYDTGDPKCNTHHVVIVPDTALVSTKMNATATTEGGYVGSDFYTGSNNITAKATVNSTVESAFGAAHILTHSEKLSNAVTDGYETASAFYDSTFELMSEVMVYGHDAYHNAEQGINLANYSTVGKTQLPLFKFTPNRITATSICWLRDVADATRFAAVRHDGTISYGSATGNSGVRPVFGICA